VIGNVLRSSRYGAISSRLGRVQNTLAAIIFSDTEIFSNLELTQAIYDMLLGSKDELDFPLLDKDVQKAVENATNTLLNRLVSRTPVVVRGESLQGIFDETIALYRDTESVKSFLQEIEKGYLTNGK
jgi:CRISPR-associated protein Csc2